MRAPEALGNVTLRDHQRSLATIPRRSRGCGRKKEAHFRSAPIRAPPLPPATHAGLGVRAVRLPLSHHRGNDVTAAPHLGLWKAPEYRKSLAIPPARGAIDRVNYTEIFGEQRVSGIAER